MMTLIPIACLDCGDIVAEATIEDGLELTVNDLLKAPTLKGYSYAAGKVLCNDCVRDRLDSQ